MNQVRLKVYYSGRVQGVGFRYTVKSLVAGFDVRGTIRNLADGRVELIVEGTPAETDEFRQAIRDSGLGGLIDREDAVAEDVAGQLRGFEIVR